MWSCRTWPPGSQGSMCLCRAGWGEPWLSLSRMAQMREELSLRGWEVEAFQDGKRFRRQNTRKEKAGICEFEVSLVYRATFRTIRAVIQRNPLLKNKNNKQNKTIICMYECLCMGMQQEFRCLSKPEVCVGSLGAGIISGCVLPYKGTGIQTWDSWKSSKCSNCWAISPVKTQTQISLFLLAGDTKEEWPLLF